MPRISASAPASGGQRALLAPRKLRAWQKMAYGAWIWRNNGGNIMWRATTLQHQSKATDRMAGGTRKISENSETGKSEHQRRVMVVVRTGARKHNGICFA